LSAPSQRPIDIQGHRGARGLFPENTLEGFAATLRLGVGALELDIGMTADDVVVVSHDPALNPDIARAPDSVWLAGPGPLLRSLRYEQVTDYDVGRIRPGSAYAALFPEQRAIDGARIPRLRDVLRLAGEPRLTIELKTFPDHPDWTADPVAMANGTIAILDEAGATPRTMLESFDWRCLHHLQATRPDIPLGWLTRASLGGATSLWWNGSDPADHAGSVPRAVAAQRATTWLPDHHDLTRADVEAAHQLGMQVIAWTVNEPSDMRRLVAWGIDGVISDRPDLMATLAGSAATRSHD